MPDCLSAGIIVADHVCEPIDHMPAAGELVISPNMQLSVGGCASNVAVDLACLGVDVGIVGRIGDDVFGRFVRGRLIDSGVDCTGLVVSRENETSGSLVINVQGEDRRFIHTIGANAEFNGDELTEELLSSCRILYLGGYCLMDELSAERAAALFRVARGHGVRTVLDVVIPSPGDYWDRLIPILPETDVFLPNDDEALLITGESNPRRQADAFRERGAGTVIVTCGEDGCFVQTADQQFEASAIPTTCVDGTGSGDAFVAGFIHGMLRDVSLENCIRLGSGLGARTVASLGATGASMTAEKLDNYVAAHPIEFEST